MTCYQTWHYGHRGMRRRGAMLLFFCLVCLPTMTFVGVLSVEYQRFLIAQRTAEQLADFAASAGVRQLLPNDPNTPDRPSDWLDATAAKAAALSVTDGYALALGNKEGGLWVTAITPTIVVTNSDPAVVGSKSTVDVTVSYKMPSKGFSALAAKLLGLTTVLETGTARGHAYVCKPGEGVTYDKSCVEDK